MYIKTVNVRDTIQHRNGSKPIKPVKSMSERKIYNHRHNYQNRKLIEQYRKSHPLCQRCLALNNYTPTAQIHHIQEIANDGDSQHINLLACCLLCHELITDTKPTIEQQQVWKDKE